jgi:hypothetical protein
LCTPAALPHHVSPAPLLAQYIAEVRAQVERMEASVQLARATCAVLRGLDFDAQLCVRGTLLLGQMLRWPGSSPARTAALEAGAPNVLLSILETQVRLL